MSTPTSVLEFPRTHGIAWPQSFDGKGWQTELALGCGVDQIPAAFLLDRDSKLVDPDARRAKLAAEVEKLLLR